MRAGTGVLYAGVVLRAGATAPAAARAPGPEQQMLHSLNQARAKRGLPALAESTRLRHTARDHCRRMLRLDFFGHLRRVRGPGGYRRLGEVVAWRSGRRPLVDSVLRAWLRSPGHRRVILNRLPHVPRLGAVRLVLRRVPVPGADRAT